MHYPDPGFSLTLFCRVGIWRYDRLGSPVEQWDHSKVQVSQDMVAKSRSERGNREPGTRWYNLLRDFHGEFDPYTYSGRRIESYYASMSPFPLYINSVPT